LEPLVYSGSKKLPEFPVAGSWNDAIDRDFAAADHFSDPNGRTPEAFGDVRRPDFVRWRRINVVGDAADLVLEALNRLRYSSQRIAWTWTPNVRRRNDRIAFKLL